MAAPGALSIRRKNDKAKPEIYKQNICVTVKHKQNKAKNIRVRFIVLFSSILNCVREEEEGLSITSRFNVIETFIYPI